MEDSPDFLRCVEADLNDNDTLEDGDIIATIDVRSLYTNLGQEECLKLCKEALKNHTEHKPEMIDLIIKLLELDLSLNIFEFNGELYKQTIGVAIKDPKAF